MKAAEEREESDNRIVVECDLDAAPEKVWRALTVPELVEQWLGVAPAGTGNAEPSYEIVEAEPFSRLRYAWRDGATTDPDTLVTFDLRPRPGGGTWFRLTHSAAAMRTPVAAANSNGPPMALAA